MATSRSRISRVELDRDGIAEVLASPGVRDAVTAAAQEIAATVSGLTGGHPVEVRGYVTDRAAAAVTITTPDALALQAKHGVLTRAAAAHGLDVRAYPI